MQGTKRVVNSEAASQTPSKRMRLPSATQSTASRRAPSTQQIQRAQMAVASVPQTYFVDKNYEAKSRTSASRAIDCWYFAVGTHYTNTYQPSQNEILSLQQSDQARLNARPLNLSRPAEPRLRCTECTKVGSMKIWKNSDEGGVSKGIRRHLKKYHTSAYWNACRKIGYVDTNESKQAEDLIDEPITPEGILRYLLEWIAEDDLPFNIVTHKGFRRFVSYIGQGRVSAKDLPDRHTLSSKIEFYSTEQKELIKEELKRAPGLISCTSDLWSDETQRSFMCITVHFIDEYDQEADYLIAFRVIEGDHAGAHLAETFFEVLEEFEIVEKLGMITLDNASNNDTLMAQLGKYMDAQGMRFDRQGNRLRCFPHVVNLAVQDTVKALGPSAQHFRKVLEDSGQIIDADLAAYLDSLESSVLARCRETAVALRHGQRRQGLQGTIREDNANNIYRTHRVEDGVRKQVEFTMKPLELVLDCPTRWSSTRNMIDRFIYLYPAVSRYIASVPALAPYALSHTDLQVLQDIRTVFNHAHRTQELLSSSKTPTLGFALPAYYALLYQWKQLQQRLPALSHAIGAGISKIEEYVTETRSSPVHMVAMALSPSIGYSWMRDNLSQEDALNAQRIVKDFMLQSLRRYQEQLRQQYMTSCAGLSRLRLGGSGSPTSDNTQASAVERKIGGVAQIIAAPEGAADGTVEGNRHSKRKRGAGESGSDGGRGKRARVAASNNGTSSRQIVNMQPLTRKTLAETAILLGESAVSLLKMFRSNPESSAASPLISVDTRLDIWTSIRLQVSQDPNEGLRRVRGSLKFCTSNNLGEHPDPVFYLKDPRMNPACAQIEHCNVGLVCALLRLPATQSLPNPPLMAYVLQFSDVSDHFDSLAGMHVVQKALDRSKRQRGLLITAQHIVRLCPLAPVIDGPAHRKVTPASSLTYYSSFHVNKYHDIVDYEFVNVLP